MELNTHGTVACVVNDGFLQQNTNCRFMPVWGETPVDTTLYIYGNDAKIKDYCR